MSRAYDELVLRLLDANENYEKARRDHTASVFNGTKTGERDSREAMVEAHDHFTNLCWMVKNHATASLENPNEARAAAILAQEEAAFEEKYQKALKHAKYSEFSVSEGGFSRAQPWGVELEWHGVKIRSIQGKTVHENRDIVNKAFRAILK